MDTKKKEYLGNFYRPGTLYTTTPLEVYDHDFISFAEGVVIPHGLYDVVRNLGYLHLGTNQDTSQFACASIQWWEEHGQFLYPDATALLILCDGGGSNSARHFCSKRTLGTVLEQARQVQRPNQRELGRILGYAIFGQTLTYDLHPKQVLKSFWTEPS